MGACNFESFGNGPDAQTVFNQLVERARYDYGHAGYTGTIAEKDGFVMRSEQAMTWEEAQKFMRDDVDKNEKWGPAFGIKVVDKDKSGKPFRGYLFYGFASE